MEYASIVLSKLLVLLFSYFAHTFCMSNSSSPESGALLVFKKSIVADPENFLSNWNETTPLCEWNGVFCGLFSEKVVKIDLKSKSLKGTLSPFLSNLSCLELLDLSENSFRGSIPSEFGALFNLRLLSIRGNCIQNEIPESFGMLTKLRYINLGNNQLSGNLPASMFYHCHHLSYIDLSGNSFTGVIPPQLGNHLPVLQNLLLYSNKLTGSIPASMSNLTLMEEIDLDYNYLNGTLPAETLMRMSSLKILHLSYNDFSSADENSNLDPFLNLVANLTHLEELDLAGNNLGGRLPPMIHLANVNLSMLYLQDNLIHGEIPSNISLPNLLELDLTNNLFNGTLPLGLFHLPNLQRLWLSNNFLHGEIPSLSGPLNNIGLLDLSQNKISGSIPSTLANLAQLRVLMLNGNFLIGSIQTSLGSTKLEILDLSHNRLTGIIPFEVASMSSMAIYFNLSDNLLEGEIPLGLQNMNKVRAIDLSSNHFNGSIPSSLGSCEVVELLNFSHNQLQGPIPQSLGDLLSIQSLDLSCNLLSGRVPSSLQKCVHLKLLNLSFNNLHGPIPEGLFDSLSLELIKGNNFCGSLPGIPSCHQKRKSIIHSKKSLLILLGIVSAVSFLVTVICVIFYRNIRKLPSQGDDEDLYSFSQDLSFGHPRITYRELVEATGGFDESRLIGSGSFGRVYKGFLSDNSVVAIKVLKLQEGISTRSFDRECQVLKLIRHRNLMRIITTCSLPGFKALVLPHMANGNLENHLYPQIQKPTSACLSLVDCVNICSDIAEGLAYLHHHSPMQVVHCDMKPSNILLNDDMTALVSDFGIARLVTSVAERKTQHESTSNSTANLVCGSIGYVAPEYGYGQSASAKGDVYSFGIIVLEMVTRKKPTDDMFCDGLSLQGWAKKHLHDHMEIVVSSLIQGIWNQSLEARNMWDVATLELIELGLICSQERPSGRPTMLEVADDLDRLKRYLGGDTSMTFTSSRMLSRSSTIGDYCCCSLHSICSKLLPEDLFPFSRLT